MWILECDAFEGRKLWLRPGRLYLFGRTSSEPGQLAISDKTVSRKHLTIQVDNVPEGGGRNLNSRSRVTIEDLNSKKGTLLNDVQIRGQTQALAEDDNEIKLGACAQTIRVRWEPVVLSFSFTAKELRADPWTTLREGLEQLDIKYSSEYEPSTTHVVSKKRNTSKGLQALINGRYIVTDSFITAIVEAATLPDGAEEGDPSPLEQDFERNWPHAIDHLPPRGEEPSDRPQEAYAPDERRLEVFDGYTFIFYDQKQHDNLFPVITSGKGKALYTKVVPRQTHIDDFIRHVKGVAGEKGLGSFEDGSEGRGVVVVRYLPPKDADSEWFGQFMNDYAQRLDHRPIDQREFLEAILVCDATMLRRPLQESTQPELPATQRARRDGGSRMDVDQPSEEATEDKVLPPPARRGRGRRGATSRFKGFELESDSDGETSAAPVSEVVQQDEPIAASQDSLFVSQNASNDNVAESQDNPLPRNGRRSQRKRALSPLPEHNDRALLDGIAPSTTAAKRRRVAAGKDPLPSPKPVPEPVDEDEQMTTESPPSKKLAATRGRGKKIKAGDDIIELARQVREEEEAKAEVERKTQAEKNEGIDYTAIRALHIVEECKVHYPSERDSASSRDQEIADGRWDPRWNGRKNFKRFRKQGEAPGRAPTRIILALEEVKPKEYGIGDDYWLENEGTRSKKDTQPSQATQAKETLPKPVEQPPRRTVVPLDSSDEEDGGEEDSVMADVAPPEPELRRSRAAKAAERDSAKRATQSQSQSQATSSASTRARKRAAPPEPVKEKVAKRPRRGVAKDSEASGDDSDDGLKFRFGRRKI
ncbi:hypothetical protein OQA88_1363 [Cercophora sp. LCS_1]